MQHGQNHNLSFRRTQQTHPLEFNPENPIPQQSEAKRFPPWAFPDIMFSMGLPTEFFGDGTNPNLTFFSPGAFGFLRSKLRWHSETTPNNMESRLILSIWIPNAELPTKNFFGWFEPITKSYAAIFFDLSKSSRRDFLHTPKHILQARFCNWFLPGSFSLESLNTFPILVSPIETQVVDLTTAIDSPKLFSVGVCSKSTTRPP